MRILGAALLALVVLPAARAEDLAPPAIPDEFRDAAAVVLEDARSWSINPPRNADFSVRERILVLDPSRFDDAHRAIFYDREDSKLDYLHARTVLPTGEQIEVPDDLKHDVVLLGAEGIELRSFQFVFPAVQPGSVLELEYRIHEAVPVSLKVWEPQRTIPVLQSRFGINLRQPTYVQRLYVEPVVRGEHADACEVVQVKDGVRVTKVDIVCRNLPAFEAEPHAPPENDLRLRYDVIWGHEGLLGMYWGRQSRLWTAWLESLIRYRPACKALAAEVTGDAKTEAEKLDRIYDWIKRNVEVDPALPPPVPAMPTLRHESIDEVLDAREGDPSEVAALALALLREAGLSANPILVADRSYGRFRYDAWDSLHRLLLEVGVDGRATVLDAACRACQPGITDWRYASPEGAAGIRVYSGRPVALPVVPARYNLESRAERIEIAEDGAARVEGKVVWGGQFAIDLRRRWVDASDVARRESFLSDLAGYLDELEVEFSDPADVLRDLTADYSFRTTMGATADGRLLIRPLDVLSGQVAIPIQEKRRQPLWLPFPYVVGVKVLFELPEGYEVELPADEPALRGPGMTFESRWEREFDVLGWTGSLTVDWVEIDPEHYPEAREFVRLLRHRLRRGLIARRGAP